MTKLLSSLVFIVLLCGFSFAQQGNKDAFAELDRRVRDQRGGWSGSKQPLAEAFNSARKQLGNNFEAELMRYIADDVEKHYWVSSFLVEPSYLHGNQPLPDLSLRIMNQALTSLRGKTDEESLGYTVKLNVNATILSAQMGMNAEAIQHKSEVEKLVARDADFKAWIPGMSDNERKLYNRIGINSEQLKTLEAKETEEAKIPKAKVVAGILDNRAISKPQPVRPSNVKARGKVRVGVIYDEAGKVIWAQAFEGNASLYQAAEQAAMQATFSPLILSGSPVKVRGSLTYDFK